MASISWRVIFISLTIAVVSWIWALTSIVFALRWFSVERPGPPLKELFPYGEMRIGIDPSYPPFAVATADDLFGFDIDLGKALAGRLGVPVRFVSMGFDGLYDALKTDQADLLIASLPVDFSRSGDVLYSLPYFNAGLVLVSNAGSSIQSMLDLSGASLAYEFGSEADQTAHQWLRRIPPFTTQPYELPEYALDAVRLKISQAALVDAISARLYMKQHLEWNGQYRYVTDVLYAIAVRIDRGRTWEALNIALQTMLEDGSIQQIIERWL